jgi:hypothetical protein
VSSKTSMKIKIFYQLEEEANILNFYHDKYFSVSVTTID